MASKASLFIAFFLLFSTCLAHHQQQKNQCQIRNIETLEPYDSVQAEAGVTEFWNADNQQFQCAGVEFIRHRIQPGGLLLPSYVNSPILSFIERGKGVQGVILPGCPETYEYSGQSLQDRHQKVENLEQGDVGVVPAGAAHWLYNGGHTELVAVVFFDIQNQANQLDQNHRRFFLSGNPQTQSEQGQEQQYKNSGNIFNGFNIELIAEAFNVDLETAKKLQGQRDQRGHIVNVQQDLQIIGPPQQGGHAYPNGLEENICGLKLKENIDNPFKADFLNPEVGRISNLNSLKFPILKQLQLSVNYGELHPNAMQTPHWINAHTLVYIIQGNLRKQIVDDNGNLVFDGVVREGQVVIIPQNYAGVKIGGEEGCKFIAFMTKENAMISNLAGGVSAIRSMPVDVVASAYQFSREEAQRLKNSQQQTVLFKQSSSTSQRRDSV